MNMYSKQIELTEIEKRIVTAIYFNSNVDLAVWVEDSLKSALFDIYDIEVMLRRALKEVTRVCDDESK